jgi:hypothetical protein
MGRESEHFKMKQIAKIDMQLATITIMAESIGPIIRNLDAYKKATWPRCPDEISICVFGIKGKIFRLTVAKNPFHGNTLSYMARRNYVQEGGAEFKFNLRKSFYLPNRKIAARVKRNVEKSFNDQFTDDGFIFSSLRIITARIFSEITVEGLVRHPFANRELWVSEVLPETCMSWHEYEL